MATVEANSNNNNNNRKSNNNKNNNKHIATGRETYFAARCASGTSGKNY